MRESFHEYGERERFENPNRDELRTTVSLAFFFLLREIVLWDRFLRIICVAFLP